MGKRGLTAAYHVDNRGYGHCRCWGSAAIGRKIGRWQWLADRQWWWLGRWPWLADHQRWWLVFHLAKPTSQIGHLVLEAVDGSREIVGAVLAGASVRTGHVGVASGGVEVTTAVEMSTLAALEAEAGSGPGLSRPDFVAARRIR